MDFSRFHFRFRPIRLSIQERDSPHIKIRYLGLSHTQEGATISYVAPILRVSRRVGHLLD